MSTSTATSRPSGATTTRAPRPTPAARPTAGRRRAPSRRPRRCDAFAESRRLRVPGQLPLRRRAAALRHRVAGLDADARRRHLRGDGRRRREPGRARVRPRHLRRALHHERRHGHAPDRGVRHARLHAGDVDLRGGIGLGARRRVGGRGLPERVQLPGRRGADPGGVREEHPVRALRRRVRRRPRRPGVGGRSHGSRTSWSTPSTCRTATRRPSRSWPSGR